MVTSLQNGSNSPKIKLSRSNSKIILGGIGDFSQSKKNISAFLEHTKMLKVLYGFQATSPREAVVREEVPKSQHSSGKRRGDYDDSFELDASASAGSGSKKKPKSSSSKNIGKSKGSKKSTTSSSSNSKGASKTKQEVSKKGNVKNRTDAKSKGNTSKQKKPLPDSKEEIRRRRKNFREGETTRE